jgi:beta-glucosidase
MELSRFKVSVDCDRRTEREVFFPHFKDCMTPEQLSHEPITSKGRALRHSDYLLKKVLKENGTSTVL